MFSLRDRMELGIVGAAGHKCMATGGLIKAAWLPSEVRRAAVT